MLTNLYATILLLSIAVTVEAQYDRKAYELKGPVSELVETWEQNVSQDSTAGSRKRILFNKEGNVVGNYHSDLVKGKYVNKLNTNYTFQRIGDHESEKEGVACLTKVTVMYSGNNSFEDIVEFQCENGRHILEKRYSRYDNEPSSDMDVYTMEYDNMGRLSIKKSYMVVNDKEPVHISEDVFHYDGQGRLSYIVTIYHNAKNKAKGEKKQELYSNDARGNIIQKQTLVGKDIIATEVYRYDALDRLVHHERSPRLYGFKNTDIIYNETDSHGNWTKKTIVSLADKEQLPVIYTRTITYYQ